MRAPRGAELIIAVAMALPLIAYGLTRPAVPPPRTELVLEVLGKDYAWEITYPTGVRTVNDLVVPVGARVVLRLSSVDFLYGLRIPHLGLNELAAPGLVYTLQLNPDATGTYPTLGDPMCGFPHEDLVGRLIVMSLADFETWLRSRR